MFKSQNSRRIPNSQNNGTYKVTRTYLNKRSKPPLRRFDCFDPEEDREIPNEEDIFIKEISQKICLLSLQVSRIENRLSAFETQPNDDLKKPFELHDPPNSPPTVPIRRKKSLKKSSQRTSIKTIHHTVKKA